MRIIQKQIVKYLEKAINIFKINLKFKNYKKKFKFKNYNKNPNQIKLNNNKRRFLKIIIKYLTYNKIFLKLRL